MPTTTLTDSHKSSQVEAGGRVLCFKLLRSTNLLTTNIATQVSQDYLRYALTCHTRQIPLVVDGLRAASRRVLYTAYEMALWSSKPHKKCARLGGITTGKYSPHGSVYSTIVNLSETHTTDMPLMDMCGNIGGTIFSSDKPAADRYTEVRLSRNAEQLIFDYTHLDTLQQMGYMTDNYDNTAKEPRRLPCMLPLLLLQSVTGISVGISATWLAYSEKCVRKAVKKYLRTGKHITEVKFRTAPYLADVIYDERTIESMNTGSGSIRYRGKIEQIPQAKNKNRVSYLISTLPVGVDAEKICEELANKLGDDLASISDESSAADGIRIVVQPKYTGGSPRVTESDIWRSTSVERCVTLNQYALDKNNIPRLFTFSQVIEQWAEWQIEYLTAYLQNQRKELQSKLDRRVIERKFAMAVHKGKLDMRQAIDAQALTKVGIDPQYISWYRELTVGRMNWLVENNDNDIITDIAAKDKQLQDVKGYLVTLL